MGGSRAKSDRAKYCDQIKSGTARPQEKEEEKAKAGKKKIKDSIGRTYPGGSFQSPLAGPVYFGRSFELIAQVW